MALFKVTNERLEAVRTTSFIEEKLLERKDLQRLLRVDISPIGADLMVIAEEFGDWEESNRRIDLLCLDKQARLVVVEIKRTEDGGHMGPSQAIEPPAREAVRCCGLCRGGQRRFVG